ncbi:MAG: PocR ligand-binding domain-containing protein [Candidatus Omnitrophica bacterium]|nr:PocR ligand-binding domain-containing protein [Candidatus Omnitrophota bacterium]
MDLNELIQFEKLKPIVHSFIDVLKTNIFIVDINGKILLTPKTDAYGWRLISRYARSARADETKDGPFNILDRFTASPEGYLEYKDPLALSSFAIPVQIQPGKPLAYIVVGPVILNKRFTRAEYEFLIAAQGGFAEDILSEIDQVRILSYTSLRSILELLFELSQYTVQANYERRKLQEASVPMDEIYTAILDMAMFMTQAESGSIMTVDDRTDEFMIKVSRGLDERWVPRPSLKKEEGLAGFAMKEKKTLVIDSAHPNNRIQHLLKRPEIKYSIVMPLMAVGHDALGVLNLSFRNGPGRPEGHSEEFIQNLFKLTSAAIGGVSMEKSP